jgi:hypothetical protein
VVSFCPIGPGAPIIDDGLLMIGSLLWMVTFPKALDRDDNPSSIINSQ